MKVNLPNQLTLLRLVLTIVFFVILAGYEHQRPSPWRLDACLAMFIVAAVTDYLDGYIARKQNQITALGRVLDPVVDKVLVCGAFIFLAGPAFCTTAGRNIAGLEVWMVVLILGRELLVTGLRGFSEARGVHFGAELSGKAKMWTQSVTIGVVLLTVAHWGSGTQAGIDLLRRSFVWLTVVVTAASLATYLIKARAILSETSRP